MTRRRRRWQVAPVGQIDVIANALCIMLLIHVLKEPESLPASAAQTVFDLQAALLDEAQQLEKQADLELAAVRDRWMSSVTGLPVLSGRVHFVVDLSGSVINDGLLVSSRMLQTLLIRDQLGISHVKVSLFDSRHDVFVAWTALNPDPLRTSRDSGNPTQNPRFQVANNLWKRYEPNLRRGPQFTDQVGGGGTDLLGALTRAFGDAAESQEPTTIIVFGDGLGNRPDDKPMEQQLEVILKEQGVDVSRLNQRVRLHAIVLIADKLFSGPSSGGDSASEEPVADGPSLLVDAFVRVTGRWNGELIALPLPDLKLSTDAQSVQPEASDFVIEPGKHQADNQRFRGDFYLKATQGE